MQKKKKNTRGGQSQETPGERPLPKTLEKKNIKQKKGGAANPKLAPQPLFFFFFFVLARPLGTSI
jgi:hypothetical protein